MGGTMRFDHSRAEAVDHGLRLEGNSIFQQIATELSALGLEGATVSCRPRLPLNLIAYDGVNRLYAWNSRDKKLLYVEVQNSDSLGLPSDKRCLVAPKPPKNVQLSNPVDFPVHFLSFNRVGRSLSLVGSGGLLVVDLLPQVSAQSDNTVATGVCRASLVGVDRIFQAKNVHSLRILQVSWHPYSDTHIGVLSSDGIFRLFDLSLDKERAEQEYHLQLSSSWGSGSSVGRPVSFSFGGEHLWDRFTIFIAFSNGSVYSLCPVVPFGSQYSCVAVEELAKDAAQWSTLPDTTAAGYASLALAWLESVFPGLPARPGSGAAEGSAGTFMKKAYAHVPVDASVALQGPLKTVWSGDVLSTNSEHVDVANHVCSLQYNIVGKDSIFALAGLDGQVHIYALADEVQPMWNPGIAPRLIVDADGHLLSVGMMVEASKSKGRQLSEKPISMGTGDEVLSSVWTGESPPLLQLAVVDLALSPPVLEAAPCFLLPDPAVPERLYCYHAGGVDAILLQWLPFSDNRNETSLTNPPAVFPVLDTYSVEKYAPAPLLGVVAYLDSFGETWLISVTLGGICAVVEMKANRVTAMYVEGPAQNDQEIESTFPMLSKELLQGPKALPIAQVAASGLKLTANSIEGRSILHDQCKFLHEKYIEYAHRVYVELTSHGYCLSEIVRQHHDQLQNVQEAFDNAEQMFDPFALRIQRVCQKNKELEGRIKNCSMLPALRRKPLTIAERDMKDLLDRTMLEDLDVLKSAVEVLKVRSEHLAAQFNLHAVSTPQGGRVVVPDSQMRRLKLAVEQLTHIVEDTAKKVQVVDESVKHREILKDR